MIDEQGEVLNTDNVDAKTMDFINKYTSHTPQPQTDFPVDISFDKTAHPIYNKEVKYAPISTQPLPTAFETIKGEFKDMSEWNTLHQFTDDLSYKNPFTDFQPNDWSAADDPSVLEGVSKENQGYVLSASTPNDAKNRQYQMIERQLENENWQNGTTLMKIIGGFGAALSNPSSWIPIARAAKYAKYSEATLYNISKVIPSVAVQSVTHNAFQQTLKNGGNIENFVMDSFVDMAVGVAFMGTGFGLGHGLEAMKFWNTRKVGKMMYDGVDFNHVINEQGELVGYKAVAMEGDDSVGAARVSFAQKFVDAEMSKSGVFSVPLLGSVAQKLMNKANPTLRGLTSRFPSVRAFTNAIASHGIETEGIKSGEAAPDRFDDLMQMLDGENRNMYAQYKGFYQERIGIDPNSTQPVGFAKKTAKQWSKADGYISEEAFGGEVQNVLLTEIPSPHSAVNNAAQMMREIYDETYKAYLTATGREATWLPPKTAKGYLSRVYNQDALLTNPDKWTQMVFDETKKAEAIIDSHMKPIEALEAEIKSLKLAHAELIKKPNVTNEQIEVEARHIEFQRKQLRLMKNRVHDALRENEDLRMHVEDPNALSAKESMKLKKILKPVKDIEKKIKAQQSQLASLKQEVFFTEEKATKAKSVDVAKKHAKTVEKLKKDVEKLQSEVDQLRKSKADAEFKLQQDAADGKISSTFYNRKPDTSHVTFKNPNNKLKFVGKFESDDAIKEAAMATRNTLLNQSNEQTANQVLNRLTGRIGENPIQNRTLMIKDTVLAKNGFLSKNIPLNVANYTRTLGRIINMKRVFGDLSHDGGIEPILERLTNEHNAELTKLTEPKLNAKGEPIPLNEKQTEAQKKEIRKLKKDFDQAVEFMNHSYNRMIGKNNLSTKQRNFSLMAITLAAATKLGFVPLTMSQDLTAIVFKQGFWPTIRDGLLPMLTTFGGHLKTKNAEHVREVAAHAHLANNHILTGYADRNMSGVTEQHVPIQGKLATGLEWLAHTSNNLNGTTYIENWLQRWTASVVQSRIIKSMLDFEAGNLSKHDHKAMLLYGLDPKEWSGRILEGWKSRGSDGNGFGGYQSRYWEWADTATSNKFAFTVMRATRDTIIRRGMMDAPFFTDSSLWGTMYSTFKGWSYASGTRYLIPLLQDPANMQKLLGTSLMLGAGATIDPLRKIAMGQEVNLEDEHLFAGALLNSGVFSIPTEAIQEINILSGGKLLKGVTNDRYRDRTIAGIAAGPIGGMTDDLIKIIRMMGTGNYNENDVKKMTRMLPLAQTIWFRGATNSLVESLQLPKTEAQAAKQNS